MAATPPDSTALHMPATLPGDSAGTGDSLHGGFQIPTDFAPAPADTIAWAMAEEVFGAQSQLAASVRPQPEGADYPLSSQPVFQVSVVLLAACYCLLAYYFRSGIVSLVKMLRSKIYTDKLLEEANHTFTMFLNLLALLGVAAAAIGLVRLGEIFAVRLGTEIPIPDGWVLQAAVPLTAIVIGAVWLYRRTLLQITGAVTLSHDFTRRLWYLRKLIYALATLLLTPPLLLLALNRGGTQIAISCILITGLLLYVGFLLYKTYKLFEGEKVSILHWILYLCAVEILPVSLTVALISKINY